MTHFVYEFSVRSKTCKEVFQPVTLFISFKLVGQLSSDFWAFSLRALCHCIRNYLRIFIYDPLLDEVTHCL